MRMVLLQSRNT